MKSNDYTLACLREAITTTRQACDRAEARILRKDYQVEELIAFVQHEFVWGLANANSGIESALSECLRQQTR